MRKVLFLAMLVFILSSCRPAGLLEQGKVADFRQGVDGLVLTILPGTPPKETFEGSPFRIAVKIQNSGAYDTARGEVKVVGLSEAWNPLVFDDIMLPSLRGRSLEAPEGDIYVAEFSGRNVALPPGVSEYRSKFLITADYEYSTIAQLDVCVNPELLVGLRKDKSSCDVKDSVSLSGQGAPIAVTRVNEVVSPSGEATLIEFTLTVENRGNGEVISPVEVGEIKLANRLLDCTPLTLKPEDIKENRNQIVCRTIEPSRSPYTTPLSVSLFYTYRVTEEGEFLIKKLLQ